MGSGISTTPLSPNVEDHARLFAEADQNEDGKASLEELVALAKRYGQQTAAAWPKSLVEETIKQHDEDKDGCLNMAEFEAALRALREARLTKEKKAVSACETGNAAALEPLPGSGQPADYAQ